MGIACDVLHFILSVTLKTLSNICNCNFLPIHCLRISPMMVTCNFFKYYTVFCCSVIDMLVGSTR